MNKLAIASCAKLTAEALLHTGSLMKRGGNILPTTWLTITLYVQNNNQWSYCTYRL